MAGNKDTETPRTDTDTTQEINLNNLYSVAVDLIALYCEEHNQDITKIEPLKWKRLLYYVYDIAIAPNRKALLYCVFPNANTYDIDKVEQLYNIYMRLCTDYEQITTIIDFSYFSGISNRVFVQWSNESNNIYNNTDIEDVYNNTMVDDNNIINNNNIGLYSEPIDKSYRNSLIYRKYLFVRKMREDNQATLEARLQDHSTNAMKILPSLNRWHGWNLPHVSKEESKPKALSVSQLPDIPQLDMTNNDAIEKKD